MTLVPDVRKIAVLRANALGDFIFTLPALDALRAAYPGAEIVLLARPWHHQFLAGRPGPIDRVVVVPPSQGVRDQDGAVEDPNALERFFHAVQRERFDLALQLHGGGRYSNPFVLRLGARLTAGLKTPDAAPLDRWLPYIYFQAEIARFLEVVSLVGAPTLGLEPRLTLTPADLAESHEIVPHDSSPLAALHPGATDPRRRWPVENFAAVGDALANSGARVVVTGIESERSLVESVVALMQRPALNLCGRLSLCGLAGLLARCRVVVSNDSGPLHLAGALGTPTVGIFWGLNLITAGPLLRARHRPHLSWRTRCQICESDLIYTRCDHAASVVADVPISVVSDSALELFHQ